VYLDREKWERLRLYRGQRVSVRRPGRGEELLFIAEDVSLPPLVRVVFAVRILAADRLRAIDSIVS